MHRNLAIVFSLVVVLTATTYFGLYINKNSTPSNDGGEDFSLTKVEDAETYTNEKGEKWGPLPEIADFTVSSKPDAYPVFVSGLISPVDVHVGDTQKMKIVINDDVPLVEVIAHIETDNDVKLVPLKLTGSKALTKEDFRNRKYIVDEDGKLLLNDGRNGTINLVNKLFKTAEAQGVVQYTYEGEWVVEDTHDTFYNTAFIAKDELGRENELVLAWSDACGIPFTGFWTMTVNCTITGQDGVIGDFTVLVGTLTLNSTFGISSGSTITISGGAQIVFNGIGKINVGGYDCRPTGYTCPSSSCVTNSVCCGGWCGNNICQANSSCILN